MKGDGIKSAVRRRQKPNSAFRGTEHLGAFSGFAPKRIGAVCDPSTFDGMLELPPGILGPKHGMVIVDRSLQSHDRANAEDQ